MLRETVKMLVRASFEVVKLQLDKIANSVKALDLYRVQ